MGSGGTWGSGLGLGAPGEMSRPGSDLMFASVAEELGLIGAMFVLVCFCVLIWRSLRAALEARSDFDRLLAVGLTTLLACQVFLITAGVSGLLPLSGIALPFVSFGNSALVSGFFLIGLLRGISAPAGKEDAAEVRPLFRRTVAQFATAAVVGLIGLVGVARLAWVQGVLADQTAGRLVRTPDADRVVRAKVNPRLTGIERSIRRGSIYDREGRVLATSRLDEISAAVGGDAAKVRRLAGKGRYYPRGADLAHLVGYADPGVGGPAGLEREFNSDLRGFDSYSELLQDYRAKDLPVWWPAALGGRPRREARDVVLTIDADLQRAALRILRERAGKTGRAAMTVLDPATGEVLVSVAIPNYDPNTLTPDRFRTLSADADKTHPLLDRSRFGYYPPGSTLKVATGGIGLEEGVEHSVNCQHALRNSRWTHGGEVYFRRQILDDRTDPPHGPTRMHEGLRVSCNVYFASLGLALGPERLYHGFADADRWAFSRVQPLPGFAAELPTSAFGQGTMLATPTEMARVAAAVANRGQMMRPVLWKQTRTRDGETVRAAAPDLMSRPLGEANAAAMAEMMRSVVTGGTARGVFEELPVEVAGKTGTAQTESGNKQPHSWFIGYAPYTKPSYAFSCVIENGGYGKRGAAPALRDILAEVYRRGGG
jgi:peptidoglycan glycosyltransferase